MLKLIKIGVGLNALCLFGGFINSQRKLPHETNVKKVLNKQELDNFNKDYEEFKSKYPNFANVQQISRKENVDKAKKEKYDMLIIGGGSSGAGVLMEGYERGLKCALIEANDFASGTSSRSTKLIHGGIRYLQDAFKIGSGNHIEKFKLVFEALQERDFFINSAPFMNSIVEIKIPSSNYFWMDFYFMGVVVYHFLYAIQNFPSFINTLPWPRLYPGTKESSFFEGQMFDSRQCLLSLLTCAQNTYKVAPQANCLNYTLFKEYIYDSNGKIIGIKAQDRVTNQEFEIYAECIVNCTGIFADTNLNKEDKLVNKLITTSKGSHIVVDKELLKLKNINTACMLPNTSDGRILFLLPYQRNYFIIGTTDNEMEKSFEPFVNDVEVNYIFNELKHTLGFKDEELKKYITSTWAGMRPLVRDPGNNGGTKSLARNHIIRYDKATGLVSLMGGKWTTYRRMGQDVVDLISKNKLIPGIKEKSLLSGQQVKLSGGVHHENVINKALPYNKEKEFYTKFSQLLCSKYNINQNLADSLIFKYGIHAEKVLELDKTVKPNERFVVDNMYDPILTAEVIYSVNNELAVKPNDFICRRTGLAFVDSKSAEGMIEKVATIMSKEMKWSSDTLKKETEDAKRNFKYFI